MSNYARLTHAQLAVVVPELLLIGQLIDRAAMGWVIGAGGREVMTRVAIEEWMAASPIYTRRMQQALNFTGDDVPTIVKGLQLDIGAPPQFMDFRFEITDTRHGRFWLDHCGALLDVEPMGPDYVRAMCHTIEDPTFEATAVATNPRAQVRPVHRPPRSPADRTPHCEWTIVIDDAHPPVSESPGCRALQRTQAATWQLDPVRRCVGDIGAHDYAGPVLSDLDFGTFSHGALIRIANEICLQMHLLVLGFTNSVRAHLGDEAAREIGLKAVTGISEVAAARLVRVLPPEAALLAHPLFNPGEYAGALITVTSPTRVVVLTDSAAQEDGAWISLCGPDSTAPLEALVAGLGGGFEVQVHASRTGWTLALLPRDPSTAPPLDSPEVALTRLSAGVDWQFQHRNSLPIWPITSKKEDLP